MYKYKNLCETNDPYVFKEKIDLKKLNIKSIEKKILKGLDIIDRNEIYKVKKINKTFPRYILENREILKDWII